MINKPIKRALLDEVLRQTVFGGSVSPAKARHSTVDLVVDDESEGARSRVRILLVDDSPINQRVGLRMLERLGYHPDVVANGAEAIAAVRRIHYDVVLMDIQMPEVDGLEATRAIRRLDLPDGQPRIIAMTAAATSADEARCRDAGMDDYVTKPVQLATLRAVLERA